MSKNLIKEELTENGLKIKYFNGNILDADADYLLHQVNCRGVMGAGLAKQIRLKWPKVYNDYIKFIKEYPNDISGPLGQMSMTYVGDYHHTWVNYIVNLFAQDNYGRNGRYTNYTALETALRNFMIELDELFFDEPVIIAIPYKMSCGLAGGNWDTVLSIIKDVFSSFNGKAEIHIYQLD